MASALAAYRILLMIALMGPLTAWAQEDASASELAGFFELHQEWWDASQRKKQVEVANHKRTTFSDHGDHWEWKNGNERVVLKETATGGEYVEIVSDDALLDFRVYSDHVRKAIGHDIWEVWPGNGTWQGHAPIVVKTGEVLVHRPQVLVGKKTATCISPRFLVNSHGPIKHLLLFASGVDTISIRDTETNLLLSHLEQDGWRNNLSLYPIGDAVELPVDTDDRPKKSSSASGSTLINVLSGYWSYHESEYESRSAGTPRFLGALARNSKNEGNSVRLEVRATVLIGGGYHWRDAKSVDGNPTRECESVFLSTHDKPSLKVDLSDEEWRKGNPDTLWSVLGEWHPANILIVDSDFISGEYKDGAEYRENRIKFRQELGRQFYSKVYKGYYASENELLGFYRENGRYAEALTVLDDMMATAREAGEVVLSDYEQYVDLADSMAEAGMWVEAESALDSAIELAKMAKDGVIPDDYRAVAEETHASRIFTSRARMLALRGEVDRLAKLLEEAEGLQLPSWMKDHSDGAITEEWRYFGALVKAHQGDCSSALGEKFKSADIYELCGRVDDAVTFLADQRNAPAYSSSHPERRKAAARLLRLVLKHEEQRQYFEISFDLDEQIEGSFTWLRDQGWLAGSARRTVMLSSLQQDRDLVWTHARQASDRASTWLAAKEALLLKDAAGDVSSAIRRLATASTHPRVHAIRDRYRQTNADIASLAWDTDAESAERLASLSEQREDLERELGQALAAVGRVKEEPNLELLQKALGSQVLVDYRVYHDVIDDVWRLAAVVVDKKTASHYDLGAWDPIDRRVRDFRTSIVEQDTEKTAELSKALYKAVWGPLRLRVSKGTIVQVSPDDNLHLLPFAALRDGRKYLLERHALRVLGASRDLLRDPLGKSSTSPVVVYAPAYSLEQRDNPEVVRNRSIASTRGELQFSPLSGAASEGGEVMSRLRALSPQDYSDVKATESAVKQVQSPRYLHIATHGFFLNNADSLRGDGRRGWGEPQLPVWDGTQKRYQSLTQAQVENPLLRSGLALAGANDWKKGVADYDDGVLTALEVLDLDLAGTELVVLSACETGVGEIRTGEGMASLQRAFLDAGADSVIYSLWKVSDEGTRELMVRLYAKLIDQQKSPLEALRTVQLELMREDAYAEPWYWAAFTGTAPVRRSRDPVPIGLRQVQQAAPGTAIGR